MQVILDACRWTAAAGLFIAIAGCGGGGSVQVSTVPGPQLNLAAPSGQYNALVFTLTTDKKTYSLGEPVLATMAVKNTGSQTLYFDSGSATGGGADYLIVQQGSTEAWNSALHGGSLGGIYVNVPIAPGQTLPFGTIIWNQSYDNGQMSPNNSGRLVPAGTYTLRTYTTDNFYGENVNTQALSWYETNFAAPLVTISIQ